VTKISQLSSIGDSLAVDDQFIIRDVSDVSTPNKSVTVSGITRALDLGTAAAPAIAFASDKNTGIYSPGADQVAISTNGTARLYITADGKIGIGTTGPTSKLAIHTTSNTTALGITDETASDFLIVPGVSSGVCRVGPATGAMALYAAGTEHLRITVAGNVGIGTSAPGARLSVMSADNLAATTIADFGASNGTSAIQLGYNRITQVNSTTASAFLQLGVSNKTDAIHIDGTGKVGIGTTSPTTTLDVNGSIACSSTAGGIAFTNNSSAVAFSAGLYRPATDNLGFVTGGSEKARLDGSGRLLVGTSSDSGGALLQINGDRIRIGTAKTPASATDTGTTGEICWDASYIYVCTATNTWKRTAISTW
jgi:hypothetical protein